MARECATGKGRALVLPGGRTRSRCVQESPTCSPPLATPRCQMEHTFPLAPWGLPARTFQPPRIQTPLLSREHSRTDPLDILRPQTSSPLGYTRFWDPKPLPQEYRKLGPCPNGRPRMKVPSEGLRDPGRQPLSTGMGGAEEAGLPVPFVLGKQKSVSGPRLPPS